MKEVQKTLQNRINYLSMIIKSCEESLRNAPKGRLRSTHKGKIVRYYYRDLPDARSGRYLNKTEDPLVRALVQKEYEEKLLRAAKAELKQLQDLSVFIQHSSIETVDQLIHENKRSKITPLFLSDEEFIKKWQAQEFEKSDFEADDDLISDRGEKMRSKSELLIANSLNRRHIPYFYEKPVQIDGKVIFPDFTALNVAQRCECIWEHFGMMSDPSYADKALYKLNRYMANGYLPGKNLILSMESESVRFGTRQIETIISGYLL